MRFLFCNDICPGRFGSIPSRLASNAENTVMFLSFHARQKEASERIVHARLNLNRERGRVSQHDDVFLAECEKMFRLGKQALKTFIHIRDSDFIPDMIFVSFFDGPAIFLRHAFPHAFIVSYFNGFRGRTDKPEERMKAQAVMDLQRSMAAQSNLYFVRSEEQKSCFPKVLQPIIHVWLPHVNTQFFSPRPPVLSAFFPDIVPGEGRELVTMHMKGGESSAEKMMQVVLGLLTHRPACLVALTFGKGKAKERWESACASLPKGLRARLFLAEGLDDATYRNLLCSTDIHVFPERISPPLQEMLESMSCETLLMTPVSEENGSLLKDGETMLAFPESDGKAQLVGCWGLLDFLSDMRNQAGNRVDIFGHGVLPFWAFRP